MILNVQLIFLSRACVAKHVLFVIIAILMYTDIKSMHVFLFCYPKCYPFDSSIIIRMHVGPRGFGLKIKPLLLRMIDKLMLQMMWKLTIPANLLLIVIPNCFLI